MLRFFSKLFLTLIAVGVLAFGSIFGVFHYFGKGLPNYQQLANYEPPILTRFYANDGRMFGEYAHEKRLYVPLKAIPMRVRDAFLSAEDKNFYSHMGVDLPSILMAAMTNLSRIGSSKRPVGASTITQQVAKNFLLSDISNLVSLERKIKEAILAIRIESAYTKNYILELYLNEIYLGIKSYGVAAAALNYFNKSLDELTVAEAAYLAALPKAPSRYHPVKDAVSAKIRRDYVIRRMYADGKITRQEEEEAIASPLVLQERNAADSVSGSYFAEEVRRELVTKFGEKSLYNDGYVVRTTLNPTYQKMATKALRDGIESYDRRHGWRGPVIHLGLSEAEKRYQKGEKEWVTRFKGVIPPSGRGDWKLALVLAVPKDAAVIGFPDGTLGKIPLEELKWARKYIGADAMGPMISQPDQVLNAGDMVLVSPLENDATSYHLHQMPEVSGGIVVMDPHTGRVLAIQGGFSFNISQFNRATQAMRQAGSAFKTIVFLAALERGLTPTTTIYDTPFSIYIGYGQGYWTPHNYDNKFKGAMTLRRGFELSQNLGTIRMVHERVGIKNVGRVAVRLGVFPKMPNELAMVLGAGGTTLLKMTTAHAMIANGGKQLEPTLIDRIQNRRGETVFSRKDVMSVGNLTDLSHVPTLQDLRAQVIDPITNYQMISFLEGVVQRGTGRQLIDINYPLAGKTGTTNDFKDAWFIGFSSDLVVGVYIGFDHPHYMGKHQGGANVALPVAKNFFVQALKGTNPVPFRVPSGVKLMRINVETGRPAKSGDEKIIWEAFKPGTNPSTEAIIPDHDNEPRKENQGTPASQASDSHEERSTHEQEEDVPHDAPASSQSSDSPSSVPSSTPVPDRGISGTGGLY